MTTTQPVCAQTRDRHAVKTIIFDFDGTIADSFAAIVQISNRLAAEFGYPEAGPEEVAQLKNLSSREIVRRSRVSPLKLPFLLRRLRGELRQEIGQLQPIAGMDTAIAHLYQQGYRLGIVTSNSKENVAAFLQAQALDHAFDFIGSGLALFGKGRILRRILKRYRLHPKEVLYVGDETRDIEAAHHTGIRVVAVGWGFNSTSALVAAQPDFLIQHPAELLNVVKEAT